MLYNNIYQYAINGAIYSIKYVQIHHYIEHVNKQPILHNIYVILNNIWNWYIAIASCHITMIYNNDYNIM